MSSAFCSVLTSTRHRLGTQETTEGPPAGQNVLCASIKLCGTLVTRFTAELDLSGEISDQDKIDLLSC